MSENRRLENGGLYKILVIDDDAALRRMVRAQLAAHYEVILAESGEQALSLIGEELSSLPDLILLDIDMPGMDGYETLKKLRADPDAEDIPVIFLTGLDGVRDQVKGLESGVADYITKPFVKDVMLARLRLRLEAGMERRRMRSVRKSGLVIELDEEKFGQLTETLDAGEKRVARLIALGRKNREIASEISYSLDGVKKLAGRIYDKTGLSRDELRSSVVQRSGGMRSPKKGRGGKDV
jgi:putative two-component system response regulator